ncbi:MAG: hypothetical protein WCJ13_05250, partial [Coriobacteriia bacterium]
MSAVLLLSLQIGPALIGALFALAFDAFDRRATAVASAAIGLLISGGFGLWAGVTAAGATAFDVLRVGGAFSTVPGLIA